MTRPRFRTLAAAELVAMRGRRLGWAVVLAAAGSCVGGLAMAALVLPVVLFPLIWSALFFYTLLDRRLARAWAVTGVLVVAHAGLIAQHVMTTQAAAKPAAVAATPGATGATP